jgi:hypothetical protein
VNINIGGKVNTRKKSAPLRLWASGAFGAALLSTSIFTGVGAANAAVTAPAQSAPLTVIAETGPISTETATPSPTGDPGGDAGCGGCTGTPTPTPTESTPWDDSCGCTGTPTPTPTESAPEEEWCGCTPAPSPSESETAPAPSGSEAAPLPESGGPGRGLAVQTAVDARSGEAGTQAALTLWSAATGLLGLGCAAAFVALFRRTRRES